MLPLTNQIHLWFACEHDCSPDLLQRYRLELMNEEERARGARFYFEADRNRFALTRALVRTVLSRYCPTIGPHAWQFGKNDHGRPFIANPNPPALNFNLSHTKGLIVLAVSAPQTLGVDIENFVDRPAPLDVAEHYFSADEAQRLMALPESARQARFYQYWTLKESYIKAKGKGLAIPLDQFSMEFPAENQVELTIHAAALRSAPEDIANWRCWLLQVKNSFFTALCIQNAAASAPQLMTHEVLPLAWQRDLPVTVLRQSAWGQV